jgi:hypothetical protein
MAHGLQFFLLDFSSVSSLFKADRRPPGRPFYFRPTHPLPAPTEPTGARGAKSTLRIDTIAGLNYGTGVLSVGILNAFNPLNAFARPNILSLSALLKNLVRYTG